MSQWWNQLDPTPSLCYKIEFESSVSIKALLLRLLFDAINRHCRWKEAYRLMLLWLRRWYWHGIKVYGFNKDIIKFHSHINITMLTHYQPSIHIDRYKRVRLLLKLEEPRDLRWSRRPFWITSCGQKEVHEIGNQWWPAIKIAVMTKAEPVNVFMPTKHPFYCRGSSFLPAWISKSHAQ